MKSVLISIKPKWCELIASGKKTIEVRKTRPKCDVPFKCYIYCTKNNKKDVPHLYINSDIGRKNYGITEHWRSGIETVDVNSHLPNYRYYSYLAESKVIGEFVCDCITGLRADNGIQAYYNNTKETCIDDVDIIKYAGGKMLYYWHISDLKIYDKPKELDDFWVYGKSECNQKKCNNCLFVDNYGICDVRNAGQPLFRPPQSWCYVEEME